MDSATLLALELASGEGAEVAALFVDYGQAAARAELEASTALASFYGVAHQVVRVGDFDHGPGEILGRNALLLHVALFTTSALPGIVEIGIHGGTPYRDCSQRFMDVMQASFAFHTDGRVTAVAPFIGMDKSGVLGIASELDVPLRLTHSCEAGDLACGVCLSCRDREDWFAGTK